MSNALRIPAIPPCSTCGGKLDSYFCPRCIRYESLKWAHGWKATRGLCAFVAGVLL